jgi:hypothetical protein
MLDSIRVSQFLITMTSSPTLINQNINYEKSGKGKSVTEHITTNSNWTVERHVTSESYLNNYNLYQIKYSVLLRMLFFDYDNRSRRLMRLNGRNLDE